MFRAAIFDLDGVVVDTVPFHFRAWKQMFSEHGVTFDFDDYKSKVDGIPRLDGARAILTDLSDDEIKGAAARKQEYLLELIERESVPVYDSTVELIDQLRAHQKKVAIASSSRNAKRVLQSTNLLHLVDTIVDGHDITRGKPDPQLFQLAADRLGCNCKECVVFEDAVLGVEAAIAGGMACVGIDRYGKPERLAQAQLVVKDLAEVDLGTLERMFE